MNKPRFLLLAGMILAAAASRLIPHPAAIVALAAVGDAVPGFCEKILKKD